MQMMSGADAFLLWEESPAVHMHTLKLAIVRPDSSDKAQNFDRFRQLVIERLPLLLPFRRIAVPAALPLLPFVWMETGQFDLDYHLQKITLPQPGGDRELNELMGDVISVQLRRDRPLWQLFYIEGLQCGRIAYLLKIHHAVADGSATAALVMGVLKAQKETLSELPQHQGIDKLKLPEIPEKVPLNLLAIKAVLRGLLLFPTLCYRALRSMTASTLWKRRHRQAVIVPPFDCPATRFNAPPTPNRIVANVTLSLADLKIIKSAFHCTINDVYLCLIGGALHRYLKAKNELPQQALSAVVPVSVRQPGEDPTVGNAVSQWFTTTGSHISDPIERLYNVKASTVAARSHFSVKDQTLAKDWFDVWPLRKIFIVGLPILINKLIHKPSYNLVVSNVPGPDQQLYSDGAEIETIRSVGPLTRQQGLNVTAWSYKDQFSISFHACREQVPDLDELALNVLPECEALRSFANKITN